MRATDMERINGMDNCILTLVYRACCMDDKFSRQVESWGNNSLPRFNGCKFITGSLKLAAPAALNIAPQTPPPFVSWCLLR